MQLRYSLESLEVSCRAQCEGATSRPNKQVPTLQCPEDGNTLHRTGLKYFQEYKDTPFFHTQSLNKPSSLQPFLLETVLFCFLTDFPNDTNQSSVLIRSRGPDAALDPVGSPERLCNTKGNWTLIHFNNCTCIERHVAALKRFYTGQNM